MNHDNYRFVITFILEQYEQKSSDSSTACSRELVVRKLLGNSIL